MRTRFIIWTMAAILVVDLIAFSVIIFGLNYFRLLQGGGKPDLDSVLSFWNHPLSVYSFTVCGIVVLVHGFCCIFFTSKTFFLFKQVLSRAHDERSEYLRFSDELRNISEKLETSKSDLCHSRRILSQFLGYSRPHDQKGGKPSIFMRRG